MAHYTELRAHYGGVSGSIIPFSRKLSINNSPTANLFETYVPAGFLRCDGSLLQSSQYPILSEILGVGDRNKFLREGEEISSTQFKLPDLGSKYIVGGRSSGGYLNETITNPQASSPGSYRVGAETLIQTLVGDEITITYDGSFKLVDDGIYPFIGNPTFKTITSDGNTLGAFLSNDYWQAHGHEGGVAYLRYRAAWNDGIFVNDTENGQGAGGANGAAQNEGNNSLINLQFNENATFAPEHKHSVLFPGGISTVKQKNTLGYQVDIDSTAGTGAPQVEIDPLGLESTVTLTTSSIYKLDEVTPPFFLVEYLIKI